MTSASLSKWLTLCAMLFVGLTQMPAHAQVELCPRTEGAAEIRIDFLDAAQVRLLDASSGNEVARFDGGVHTSQAWQAPVDTQSCYRLDVKLSAAPDIEPFCLRNNSAIGYSIDAQAALAVRIDYRNAQLEMRGVRCGTLPDERAAMSRPPLTTARPRAISPTVSARPPATAWDEAPSPAPMPGRPRALDANPDAPPAFAWPPPRPSTRRTLTRPLVAANIATPSLGHVADRLQAALEASGYTEYSYYSVPGGFALATRLERIHADGRSMTEPKRWEMAGGPLTRFELGEYLRALFDAELGHFRVIVFIVTPKALVTGTEPPTAAAALDWPLQGVPVLPAALRILAYDSAFQTHALIYEFETHGQGQPARFKANSTITGETHLRRANILGALQP